MPLDLSRKNGDLRISHLFACITSFIALIAAPDAYCQFVTSGTDGTNAQPITALVYTGTKYALATEVFGTLPAFGATPTFNLGTLNGAATAALQPAINGDGGSLAHITNFPVAATYVSCAALCANLVIKGSAGTAYSFEVQADSTLSGAAWYVMIYDATSAPADGAITPAKCYAQASGTTQMGGSFATGGVAFTTGIVIGVSTTGCFTKTASTHAFISGDRL